MLEATAGLAERTAADAVIHVDPASIGIRERLVVAPCGGRFLPLPPETFTCEGEWVEAGQPLAHVRTNVASEPVLSGFRGWVMGMLAVPGQPVARGDALFWIRAE
jgi:biotin carboxyl carrier protein